MGSPITATNAFPLTDTSVSADWVLPVASSPVANATVAWDALGTLTQIFSTTPETLRKRGDNSGKKTILTPGLVNTHTHLELTFPHTIPPHPSKIFSDWLTAVIATVQHAALGPNATEQLHKRIAAGAQQALSTGTTCINDITRCLETPTILSNVGLRGVVSWECFHPEWKALEIDPIVRTFQQFQQRVAHAPLIKAGLSPHSLYNMSPAALLLLLEAFKEHTPWLIHAHVAECIDELAWLSGQPNGFNNLHATMRGSTFGPQPKQGKTTFLNWLDYLTQHSVLPSTYRWVLAHGAVLCPEEWQQLAQWQQQGHSIGVSHCLQSNQWLHQATIPSQHVQQALPTKGLLSIGTDSPLSLPHPSTALDLRCEARALHRHHQLSAEVLLTLATVSGAQQLGFGELVGQLTIGYQADMVLWQVPQNVACNTPQQAYDAWLHPETTVAGVWVQGRFCENWV